MLEIYSNIVLDISKGIDISKYDNCSIFNDNLFKVTLNNYEGLIDKKGNEVIEPIYHKITNHGDFIKVEKDRKCGLFYSDGTIMTYPIYDDIDEFKNGVAKTIKNKKYGYIDEFGKEILIPIYSKIGEFSEDIVKVCFQGEWGYINKQGDVIKRTCYDNASDFEDGLAIIRHFKKYGIINKNGEEIVAPNKYIEIKRFHDALAAVKIEEEGNIKHGYIDKSGNEVIKPIYEDVKNFHNNIAWVKFENKWLLIDNKGDVISEEVYDSVVLHPNNYSTITKKKEKYGLVDKEGQVIIPNICDNISFIEDEYILIDGNLFNVNEIGFKYVMMTQDYNQFIEIPFSSLSDLNNFDNDLSGISGKSKNINVKKLIRQ